MLSLINDQPIERVRGILLTGHGSILMIKRVKPHRPDAPYWVAPGGGVEVYDLDLHYALHRELREELGAEVDILKQGFVLRHVQKDRQLEEYFFICRLHGYDLVNRHGPEFSDPTRGEYIPDEVPLDSEAIRAINFRTPELKAWLLHNLDELRVIA